EERGVFRTRDGGRTWQRVLYRGPQAGAADLWLDPSNPRVLYAGTWQARRSPWLMESGGPDSALYRSHDGGGPWTEPTDRPGPPKGLLGRIGVCAAPSRPARVWAVIEAEGGGSGLYRSEDHGQSWECLSRQGELLARPWYYSHIVPDPVDADTLYSLNVSF